MRGPNAASTTTSKSGGAAMAAFKQDLLRNLLLGLRARPFDAMSLQERKRAVKCSADVAMAAAAVRRAGGRARWPKAILAAATAGSSSHSRTCKVRKSACKCKRVSRWRVDDVKRRIRGAYYAAASGGGAAAASCDVARRLVRSRAKAGAEEDDGAPEGDTRRERRRHGRGRAAP